MCLVKLQIIDLKECFILMRNRLNEKSGGLKNTKRIQNVGAPYMPMNRSSRCDYAVTSIDVKVMNEVKLCEIVSAVLSRLVVSSKSETTRV